eukprot:TRINITY_DN2243_c1_g1_i8.p1 TRINITY_DN2243_c1_g1~~TRINITY_DN2243_c1_g1_i8.p1  ORF type:complete len:151 (-),score=6.62 TRINITY_DN2243_c1_g1_i8:35-487(-)
MACVGVLFYCTSTQNKGGYFYQFVIIIYQIVYSMANLFRRQASNYSKFRPRYPEHLYDVIFQYSGKMDGQLAVDIATGNGQAANSLAKHFQHVVGIDSSEEQISFAVPERTNVSFRVGDCHRLPFEDNSVDLLTVAQALHWNGAIVAACL